MKKLNTKWLNEGNCSECHGQLHKVTTNNCVNKYICYNCGSYYYRKGHNLIDPKTASWKFGGKDTLKKTTTLGDFLTWANKNNWWLRGFESIYRTETLAKGRGWGFTHCTSMCFVSDEEINKEVPEKTAEEWEAWGR